MQFKWKAEIIFHKSLTFELHNSKNQTFFKERRTGLWKRKPEHICCHLWLRYSVVVNQVMIVTTIFKVMTSSLDARNPLFSRLPVSSNQQKAVTLKLHRRGKEDTPYSLENIGCILYESSLNIPFFTLLII